MSEPAAPYSNPTTSLAAAESLEPVLSFLENKVLAFINARGSHGATCFEVEAGLALPHQTASARINGLQRKFLVQALVTTRTAPSGRQARVWVSRESAQEIRANQGDAAFPADTEARETKLTLKDKYLDLVGLLVPVLDIVKAVEDKSLPLTDVRLQVHVTHGSTSFMVPLKAQELQAIMDHLDQPMGK
jgi:hypothetical protein